MILRERLIQLAEEIAKLRATLRVKEAELDKLLPNGKLPLKATISFPDPTITTTALNDQSPPVLRGGSLIDRTINFFATHQTEQIGPRALRARLGLPPTQEKSLRATMGRLANDGRIRRVNRGTYAASLEGEKETT